MLSENNMSYYAFRDIATVNYVILSFVLVLLLLQVINFQRLLDFRRLYPCSTNDFKYTALTYALFVLQLNLT
jgi:hypothetical protein